MFRGGDSSRRLSWMITSIACMGRSSNISIKTMGKCSSCGNGSCSSLIYVSYGGLLMSLEGELKHIEKVKYGDRVYCLIRIIN